MRFVDSHVHLASYGEPRSVMAAAAGTGTLLVAVGVDRQSSMASLSLADSSGGCARGFVGLHPSEVSKGEGTDWVEGAAKRADGIGEVGLDPKYSGEPGLAKQREALVAQLAVAERAGLPVEVHARGAEALALDTLGSYRLTRVLLHWFQGEGSAAASSRGYFVSFGPALLSSKKLQRVAAAYDRSLTVAESDGPVAFAGLGGAGGPPLIPSVVFKLAEVWREPFEGCAEAVYANSLAFLGGKKG